MEFLPTADEAYRRTSVSLRELDREEIRERILDAIEAGEYQTSLRKPLTLDLRVHLEKQGYLVSELSVSWGHHVND